MVHPGLSSMLRDALIKEMNSGENAASDSRTASTDPEATIEGHYPHDHKHHSGKHYESHYPTNNDYGPTVDTSYRLSRFKAEIESSTLLQQGEIKGERR
jgi:hypothetical protein